MKEGETLMEIQRMSIEEKIAALSPTDKAYIRGYVERAVFDCRKLKAKRRSKKTAQRKEEETGNGKLAMQ
jgi:hypothetical protein